MENVGGQTTMPASRLSDTNSRIQVKLSEEREARIRARDVTMPAWGVRAFLQEGSIPTVIMQCLY